MQELKVALANLGGLPERIHIEIFNGGASMPPGVMGAVRWTPHPPEGDGDTGPLLSFAQRRRRTREVLGLSEQFGAYREVRFSGPLVEYGGSLLQSADAEGPCSQELTPPLRSPHCFMVPGGGLEPHGLAAYKF